MSAVIYHKINMKKIPTLIHQTSWYD